MSAKDLEKFCGNTPEKPEEKNRKKLVYKNNKIYKLQSEFTDEDWEEGSSRVKEMIADLDRRYCWKSFLLYSDAWGIPYDLSIPYIIVFDSWDLFLARHRWELRELFVPCEMSDEELKAIYDEFMAIIREHNSIIMREEVLAMADND